MSSLQATQSSSMESLESSMSTTESTIGAVCVCVGVCVCVCVCVCTSIRADHLSLTIILEKGELDRCLSITLVQCCEP